MLYKKNIKNYLLYGMSEYNADIFYITEFFTSDPFVIFKIKGKSHVIVSSLDYQRAIKKSIINYVHSLENWIRITKKLFKKDSINLAEIITCFARYYKVNNFVVSDCFPFGLASDLQKLKITLEIQLNPLFPKRLIKNEKIVKKICHANSLGAASFSIVEKILKSSKIKNKKIYYRNRILTSEYLRLQIETLCLKKGGVATKTIVAGGNQACDPHCIGSGPLKANELIIIDIFPRIIETGYYGDMTRTFLKGTPNEQQKKIFIHVKNAQKIAFETIKANVDSNIVQKKIYSYFFSKGFKTKKRDNVKTGFTHNIIHGIGLDLHESLGIKNSILKSGMTITVEPGLYYPNIGAVRIEDVVLIHKNGLRLLSNYHYRWCID